MKAFATFTSALFLIALSGPALCQEAPPAPGPLAGPTAKGIDPEIVGSERAMVTPAPFVPPPITRKHATKVVVTIEVVEQVKRLADGVEYLFWTFGLSAPGPFIRVREGDLVELHLANHPTSKMPHNIDLHAVTGPGGGATSSFTAPGHVSQFSFKALNPGLFVYHCATAPVGMHVANGMYGLILVEPKEGLPPVDREFYVMQSEFYTKGRFGEEGLQPFDQQKAEDERPGYVVFNGSVGSMVGDNALRAKVGERVRLFVGNAGPNLASSFHVIGEIFDHVYQEGGTKVTQQNVQTTLIPAGGSATVDFKLESPGTFVLLDHSLFRAFNKGAVGMLSVEGPADLLVYSGKEVDATYLGMYYLPGPAVAKLPDAAVAGQPTPTVSKVAVLESEMKAVVAADPKIAAKTKEIFMEKGKRIYSQTCFACHQADGNGLAGVFPPLAKSDYLMENKERSILSVMKGVAGEITVNGKKYNNVMPAVTLNDEQIAHVLTYVRNSGGNSGDMVTVEEVKKVRAQSANQ